MLKNSKFYDDILKGVYTAPIEKEASEQESNIRDIIATFGDEQLDAIAQELGMISKEASEIQQSLEDSLFEDEVVEKEAEEGEEEPAEEEAPEAESDEEPEAEEEAPEESEEEKEASEDDDFEMMKLACEEIEQELAAQDCSLADYVYTLDESLAKYAYEIADKAEKIAYVTDMPRVAVVQDLLATMNAIADANIEE